jgi:C4-dicarboxylate transporter, DcuC family
VLAMLAIKPLSLFKKYPYVLATLVLPIGQFLFISIPSAAGLALLLMATVYPIITSLGVSRLSAVALITATTSLGIGPASAIALSAANVIEMDISVFFFKYQIPLAVVISIVLTVSYYFVNLYLDRRQDIDPAHLLEDSQKNKKGNTAPMVYAILPVLPLILLLVFSSFFHLMPFAVKVDTNSVMLVGLFVAMAFELVRTRSLKEVFKSLDVFWNGMGDIFKTVVTLIVAADLFSKGLISLGFIDGLLTLAQDAGMQAAGIGIVMTVMIFLASILMGSGNAAFFAFGPLIPKIAAPLAASSVSMILPMAFAASMGRTVSPIAGVLVAAAALAKVPPFEVVKRNLIPFGIALIVMLAFNFL